jgi:hypothetical protein
MRARNSAAAPAAAVPTNPDWNRASDFSRQQLTAATEGGAVLYRGLEAMRKIQEQATRETLRRHAEAAGKLRATAAPGDLLALQSALLLSDIEDATRCWQQLLGEALEINSELLGCATRMIDTEDVFAAARLLHS